MLYGFTPAALYLRQKRRLQVLGFNRTINHIPPTLWIQTAVHDVTKFCATPFIIKFQKI